MDTSNTFYKTRSQQPVHSDLLVNNYAATDWPALNNHLWSLPLLAAVQEASSTDEAWVSWRTLVDTAILSFVPKVRKRTNRYGKPWFTSVHHRLRQRRDRLFAAAKRVNTPECWAAYRISRNCLVAAIRKAKRHFYDQMSEGLHADRGSYDWWKRVKKMCHINCPHTVIPDIQGVDTLAVTDPEKANIFCQQFAKNSQATPSSDADHRDLAMPSSSETFAIRPLSIVEVFKALSTLSVRKSTAGSLPNRILRETAEVLAQSLTALFNRCTTYRSQPLEWKVAIVTPIYKGKGSRNDPANYRPISLLNGVAKCYEALISRQVYAFVAKHKLLSPKQFGFRHHRSTVDQLVHITSTVSSAFDNRAQCDAVFLDFSKAFDRTSHRLLASCLSGWCAPDSFAWLMDFLEGRSMSVRVGTSLSTHMSLTAGVPQGSHLGPLLFNLSINSLPSIPQSSDLTLFADDSNMVCVSPPTVVPAAHTASLQLDLDRCVNWSHKAEAVFNANKCVHVPFCRPKSNPPDPRTVTMAGTLLTQPSSHRHLGIILTPSLNLSPHIQHITSKFRGRVFLLNHMSNFLPFPAVNLLYKCYVRPLLEYAVPVWMFSVSATMSTTLDKLQATAARAYLNSKLKRRPDWTTSKEDLNVLSSWESLAWRRQILGLVYFHHVFSQYPSLLSHFQLPSSQSSRHPSSIILPKAGTFFRKSTLFSLSVAWNKLPEDIRSLSTKAKFSIAVRRYHSQSMFSLKGIPDFCV